VIGAISLQISPPHFLSSDLEQTTDTRQLLICDGKSDLLWQNGSGQAAVWLMNGTNILNSALAGGNPRSSWHLTGAGDFNGDGKSDFLRQSDSGQAAIAAGNPPMPTT
jgi:hypothetical protein